MGEQLNAKQRHILNYISESIAQHRSNFFFIKGRPGRGKTFLVKGLSSMLRAQGQIVLIVGSSALSVTAYDCRRTAHHMFGIPVTDDNVNLHSSIHPHSPRADLIRNATAIIWDELPAINRATWESVDELCHTICNQPATPFGGITFIGLGDF
ncbi:hypothetical protein BDR05DRAFT_886999 [Suillus weaverae]|nr:hypothetical protein BDR05DRAFT_886999 [Suillus weaverae]